MKVTRNNIIKFLKQERDQFGARAQEYARKMADAEQLCDPIKYRNAERAWMQYEHYYDAACAILNHLNQAIDGVVIVK